MSAQQGFLDIEGGRPPLSSTELRRRGGHVGGTALNAGHRTPLPQHELRRQLCSVGGSPCQLQHGNMSGTAMCMRAQTVTAEPHLTVERDDRVCRSAHAGRLEPCRASTGEQVLKGEAV